MNAGYFVVVTTFYNRHYAVNRAFKGQIAR